MTQLDDIKDDLNEIKIAVAKITEGMEDRDRRLANLEHTIWDNGQPGYGTRIADVEHVTSNHSRDITAINERCESRVCTPAWWQRMAERIATNLGSAIVIAIIFALFADWLSGQIAQEIARHAK